jgi:ferredoxin
MAKVTVDNSLCTGCGLCESTCSDVFEMGDDGFAHVKKFESTDCDLQKVAQDCPVEAIKVE